MKKQQIKQDLTTLQEYLTDIYEHKNKIADDRAGLYIAIWRIHELKEKI